MKTDKLLQTMAWITIASTMTFLITLAFWLLYPYQIPKYNTNPQKVEKKTIRGGSYQVILVDLCRYMQYFPHIQRSFVDGIIYQIPEYTGVDKTLGCHINRVQVYVPKTLPPGIYKIATQYKWELNPVRTIEKLIYTEQFEVLE